MCVRTRTCLFTAGRGDTGDDTWGFPYDKKNGFYMKSPNKVPVNINCVDLLFAYQSNHPFLYESVPLRNPSFFLHALALLLKKAKTICHLSTVSSRREPATKLSLNLHVETTGELASSVPRTKDIIHWVLFRTIWKVQGHSDNTINIVSCNVSKHDA